MQGTCVCPRNLLLCNRAPPNLGAEPRSVCSACESAWWGEPISAPAGTTWGGWRACALMWLRGTLAVSQTASCAVASSTPRGLPTWPGPPHSMEAGSTPEPVQDWIAFVTYPHEFGSVLGAAFCFLETSHEGWLPLGRNVRPTFIGCVSQFAELF